MGPSCARTSRSLNANSRSTSRIFGWTDFTRTPGAKRGHGLVGGTGEVGGVTIPRFYCGVGPAEGTTRLFVQTGTSFGVILRARCGYRNARLSCWLDKRLLPSAYACKPFLWQNGAVTELRNTLGGANAVANQMNNS